MRFAPSESLSKLLQPEEVQTLFYTWLRPLTSSKSMACQWPVHRQFIPHNLLHKLFQIFETQFRQVRRNRKVGRFVLFILIVTKMPAMLKIRSRLRIACPKPPEKILLGVLHKKCMSSGPVWIEIQTISCPRVLYPSLHDAICWCLSAGWGWFRGHFFASFVQRVWANCI